VVARARAMQSFDGLLQIAAPATFLAAGALTAPEDG
jgi:hypothetical protein